MVERAAVIVGDGAVSRQARGTHHGPAAPGYPAILGLTSASVSVYLKTYRLVGMSTTKGRHDDAHQIQNHNRQHTVGGGISFYYKELR